MLNTTSLLLPNSTLTLKTTTTSTDFVDQTLEQIKSTETSSSKRKAFFVFLFNTVDFRF
jgi:hypothetical protein